MSQKEATTEQTSINTPMELDAGLEKNMQTKLDSTVEENSKLRMEVLALKNEKLIQDNSIRDDLKTIQPQVVEWIKSTMQDNPDQKSLGETLPWAEGVHMSKVPRSEIPLMQTLVCASVQKKRGLEVSNAKTELESALQAKCADYDKVVSECDGLKKRCGDLEHLCMSSQTQKEALIRKSVEVASHNFSAKSSREVDEDATMNGSVNPMVRGQDELTKWITDTGAGGGKVYQHPSSSHSIYGTSGEAGSSTSGMSLGERIRAGS